MDSCYNCGTAFEHIPGKPHNVKLAGVYAEEMGLPIKIQCCSKYCRDQFVEKLSVNCMKWWHTNKDFVPINRRKGKALISIN